MELSADAAVAAAPVAAVVAAECPDIQGVELKGDVRPDGAADAIAELPTAGSVRGVGCMLLAVGDDMQLLLSSAIAVRRGCCFTASSIACPSSAP